MTSAGIYSWLLTTSGIPQHIVASINALHMPQWELLLMLNVVLLLAGSFLEPPAAILILTPLLLPVVRAAGVNPIHFGIIIAVNLEPRHVHAAVRAQPVCLAGDVRSAARPIYLGVLPFVLINFAALMVITYVPAISMVLVGGY